MRALVKAKAERGIWLENVDKPTIGHNDVLIKVRNTAICGTDIHIYQWDDWASNTIPVPLTVGHEFCGEVVEFGVEVRGFEIGDTKTPASRRSIYLGDQRVRDLREHRARQNQEVIEL